MILEAPVSVMAQEPLSYFHETENGTAVIRSSDVDEIYKDFGKAILDRSKSITIQYTGDMPFSEFVNAIRDSTHVIALSKAAAVRDYSTNLFDNDSLLFSIKSWYYKPYEDRKEISYVNIHYADNAEQMDFVTEKLDKILKKLGINSKTPTLEKIQLIHDWICDNIKYSKNDSLGNSVYQALITHETKCMGYSLLFYMLAKSSGLDVHIVTSVDHAWNMIKLDGKWYSIDTTSDATTFSHYFYLSKIRNHAKFDSWCAPIVDTHEIIPSKTGYLHLSNSNLVIHAGSSKSLLLVGLPSYNRNKLIADTNGFSVQLITPSTPKIVWRSSNLKIVTVSDGRIIARKKGTAAITMTLDSANCKQVFKCRVLVK
jgi:hypothetical protein